MKYSIRYILTAVCIYFASSAYAVANNINYILMARQGDLFQNLSRISDMVANANTTGFKAEHDIFVNRNVRTSFVENLAFPNIKTTIRDTKQGILVATHRQLDAAINGEGYFMVNTPFGDMFTRNGSFIVNQSGVLVTNAGYPIASFGGGQIEFSEQDIDISIKDDGVVTANGEDRGQIGIFVFAEDATLKRVGQNLFSSDSSPQPAENYKLAQGMLESSNVNSITAMTELVNVSRRIENIKKMRSSYNQLQRGMIQKLSRN